MHTKTSIIATLGPASQAVETLEQLIGLGVSVFRLNFSHGTFETHRQTLDNINRARQSFPHCVAVLGDLCGPKIRVGRIEPDTVLKQGQTVTVSVGDAIGNAAAFTTTYADLFQDVQVGQRILLDDGQLALKVVNKAAASILCEVLVGGPLSSRKGMNLPDTHLSTPAITEQDWQCVDWAVANGLEYLALSFVQQPEEVRRLKTYLRQKGSGIQVIPKIEKPMAVRHIEAILHEADGIMVARGDLGVEMDLARVPIVQKEITALCRRWAKPVIIATQVLQSMIENASPTRAEATDISNAVLECADAVMLSGETAVGRHPVEAVKALAHICRVSEAYQDMQSNPRPAMHTPDELVNAQALARSIAMMLDEIKTQCVVIWAQDLHSIRLLSKARIDVPVVTLTSDSFLCRQLALYYGIVSFYHAAVHSYEEWVQAVELILKQNGLASAGDQVLLMPPLPVLSKNTSHSLIFHSISG